MITTSFNGCKVVASRKSLIAAIGEPTLYGSASTPYGVEADKTLYEWRGETPDGVPFTIYDYKHYEKDPNSVIDWHIGTETWADSVVVIEHIKQLLTVGVSFHVSEKRTLQSEVIRAKVKTLAEAHCKALADYLTKRYGDGNEVTCRYYIPLPSNEAVIEMQFDTEGGVDSTPPNRKWLKEWSVEGKIMDFGLRVAFREHSIAIFKPVHPAFFTKEMASFDCEAIYALLLSL